MIFHMCLKHTRGIAVLVLLTLDYINCTNNSGMRRLPHGMPKGETVDQQKQIPIHVTLLVPFFSRCSGVFLVFPSGFSAHPLDHGTFLHFVTATPQERLREILQQLISELDRQCIALKSFSAVDMATCFFVLCMYHLI